MLSKEIAGITIKELLSYPDRAIKRHAEGILDRLAKRNAIIKSCFTCGKKFPASELVERLTPVYTAHCKKCFSNELR